jgi:hypothetical protein
MDDVSGRQSKFSIVVEGMKLPEDIVARINDALQRAALTEIAALDLRGNELLFRPIMAEMLLEGEGGALIGGGGGGGGGAHIQIRPPTDVAEGSTEKQ